MKRLGGQSGPVCMMCGKPSKQRICKSCSLKVEAEAIHKKLEAGKSDKLAD